MLQCMLEDEQERASREREIFFQYMGIIPEKKQAAEERAPRKPVYSYKSRTQKIKEAELRSRLEVAAPEVAEQPDAD
jgi:hypothetical protein